MNYVMMANKSIQKCVKSWMKGLPEDIYIIEMRGIKFNALPFLINGCGFASNDKFRPTLFSSVVRHQEFKKDLRIRIDDIISNVGAEGKSLRVIDALLPCYNDMGVRDLMMYLYMLDKVDAAKCILKAGIEILAEIVEHDNIVHYSFETPDLCNTQAFSLYTLVKWILSVCPGLNMVFGKKFRSIGFDEMYESLIPETSLHWRYIKGELSEIELVRLYKKGKPQDSVRQRELLSIAMQGADVSGSDKLVLESADDFLHILTASRDYKLIMNVAYCMFNSGLLEKYDKENSELNNELVDAKKAVQMQQGTVNSLSSKVKQLTADVAEKDTEISDLRAKVAQHIKDEAAIQLVPKLEKQLQEKDIELQELFDERVGMKQEIAKLRKLLRKLPAEFRDEEGEPILDVPDIPFEEKLNKVKSLKTYIICSSVCYDGLQSGINKYNLTNFQWYNIRKGRNVSDVDLAVCITVNCAHSDVYSAERRLKNKNVPLVYVNSRNIERVINEIYEEVF